jgi:hypothetical protein
MPERDLMSQLRIASVLSMVEKGNSILMCEKEAIGSTSPSQHTFS